MTFQTLPTIYICLVQNRPFLYTERPKSPHNDDACHCGIADTLGFDLRPAGITLHLQPMQLCPIILISKKRSYMGRNTSGTSPCFGSRSIRASAPYLPDNPTPWTHTRAFVLAHGYKGHTITAVTHTVLRHSSVNTEFHILHCACQRLRTPTTYRREWVSAIISVIWPSEAAALEALQRRHWTDLSSCSMRNLDNTYTRAPWRESTAGITATGVFSGCAVVLARACPDLFTESLRVTDILKFWYIGLPLRIIFIISELADYFHD